MLLNYKVSWALTDKMIEKIANEIKAEGFAPQIVAPIPKGGWVVASLLAQRLNIKNSLSLAQVKSTNLINTYIANPIDLKNKRVLVIEDSIETGKGLFGAKQALEKLGATVKTVALYVSPAFNGTLPDYYIDVNKIPLFPWEVMY